MPHRVVVVSRHPLVGTLLSLFLATQHGMRSAVWVIDSERIEWPRTLRARVLLLVDTCYLPIQIAQLIRGTRAICPTCRFLFLLAPERARPDDYLRLLHLGADGIINFANLSREIPRAIEAISAGHLWVPGSVLELFVKQTAWLLEQRLHPLTTLTARQRQILDLVLRGLANRDIALELGISDRTVKFHVSGALAKLRLSNRRELLSLLDQRSLPTSPS